MAGMTLLQQAAQRGDAEMRRLVANGRNVNERDARALPGVVFGRRAVHGDHVDMEGCLCMEAPLPASSHTRGGISDGLNV